MSKNGKAQNGAAFMALRTGVPVIPVGIIGDMKPFHKVTLNYGKPDERPITSMTVSEAEEFINQGHFEFASMLPKIEASIDFITHGHNRIAIITSMDKARTGLLGKAGTTIR